MPAKLVKPVLFSQQFGVRPATLTKAGLLDPIINSDTRLFIDPLLISGSGNKTVSGAGFKALKKRFSEIISLLSASKNKGDVAWRNAARRMDLSERPETGLGYGGASTSGSSRPDEIKQLVLSTAKEIIVLGEDNPEIISLMGLFEDGVGPDTISDLTTNLLLPELCSLTLSFCNANKIPVKQIGTYPNALPENPLRPGSPVVLVPKDVLRELPLAVDWSDVSRVVAEIESIRDRVNAFLGPITQATVSDKKHALKRAAMSSLADFRLLFQEILAASDTYDPNEDLLNFYAFRKLITSDPAPFKTSIKPPSTPSREELLRVVTAIVEHFRYQVENNNMWELLWTQDRKPKRERASQLLFFAVADIFCKANDIDISPETHSGGGPVDFKFSKGYKNRVIVEIKRSTGTVEHGYKKQTETYKKAANTDAAIFMIMDVGGMGRKLANIKSYRKLAISAGEKPPQIEVVNAKRRSSASKSD